MPTFIFSFRDTHIMSVEYIIIQAGGRGTRLKKLTTNKPKAIVSVNNLPIIYHLFRKFSNKKFVIIGDYHKTVLDKYLEAFPEVECLTVDTDGETGTCSGISNALSCIPPNAPFMLIWSDLVLGNHFTLPNEVEDYIGISGTFSCRWSYENDIFEESPSEAYGVAGLFVFTDKSKIADVPRSGEFVKWLQSRNMIFKPIILGDTVEYGLIEKIKQKESGKCRPFNSMQIIDGKIVKMGIDDQGRKLAVREKNWYSHVSNLDIPIPKIYSSDPLTLELIDGKNIFEYDFSIEEKRMVLEDIMEGLKKIHTYDVSPPDKFSVVKAYYNKTFDRLDSVRNLIPFANEKVIRINGKDCKNVFFYRDVVREMVYGIKCDKFCLIHGDCTFSNMMLRDGSEPVFIDPRGYFGNCELIGDPRYDWAKLYYSLVGNYDQFNLGRFSLSIEGDCVTVDVRSNNWSDLESTYVELLPDDVDIKDIRFLHALIWLSLTTYAWDDYDSICAAFYLGLYYLEEFL